MEPKGSIRDSSGPAQSRGLRSAATPGRLSANRDTIARRRPAPSRPRNLESAEARYSDCIATRPYRSTTDREVQAADREGQQGAPLMRLDVGREHSR